MRCLLRCCFISYNQRNWCSYTKCWFCSWPPTNVWCFAIAYKIGKYFGKAEQSSENRKMPKGLKVFEDNIFTQAVLILLVFLILILIIQFAPGLDESVRFAGKNGLVTNGYGPWKVGGGNAFWVVQLILGSFQLVASIIAIQTGVRMFVSELQQSFQGISDKLVPGALVAVDVADYIWFLT
nr:PTS transporter subunit IIC [Mycoplasmopsis bovis]